MFPVTVTMERVFPMERCEIKGDRYTEFGFEAAGKKYYGVEVPGWPQIEAGMTVTVLLEREGDWSSVCGWVNLQTGEIAAHPAGGWILMLVAASVVTLLAASSRDAQVLLFLIPVALIWEMKVVPRRRIRRALEALSVPLNPEVK